jgi:GT2 family glycosyltransferase
MYVSLIVPNYNGRHLLEKNIPRIHSELVSVASRTLKCEIIVTDDASHDGSLELLSQLSKTYAKTSVPLRVLASTLPTNSGFSSNVNRGVASARGEIVVLFNSDITPKKGFLLPLISHFSDQSVFAVGCVDESIEPDGVVLRGRGIGRWHRGLLRHAKGELGKKTDTLWVSGGSGAFRISYWKLLGGLKELLDPFYWEDIDLSYRAQKAGYRVCIEPKSIVIHAHEEGAIKTSFTKKTVTQTAYRNQFLFIWSTLTDVDLLFSHLLWLPYHLFNALKGQDTLFLKGFFDACMRLPLVWSLRKDTPRVVTDKSVVAPFVQEMS